MQSRNAAVRFAEPVNSSPASALAVVPVGFDERGHLRFSPPIGRSSNPTVRCSEGGCLEVLLEKVEGYQQVIQLVAVDDDLEFLGLSARRAECELVQEGPLLGTPLRVQLLPEKGPHKEIMLIDTYSGPDCLDVFDYTIHYRRRGEHHTFDPQIHNEGKSGGVSRYRARRRRRT